MTLPAPKLDDLTWADMMAAIRRRIPAESDGAWTLHAPVDPGVTLLELFAYLLEQRLYWLDQVPDELVVAILGLLGVDPPAAAVPAATVLRLTAERPGVAVPVIPSGTRLSRDPAGRITFTLDDDVAVFPVGDADVVVETDRDRTTDLRARRGVPLLGADGGPAAARFTLPLTGTHFAPGPLTLLVELDAPAAPSWSPRAVCDVRPPADLTWSWFNPDTGATGPFESVVDGTAGLRRSGVVRLTPPEGWTTADRGVTVSTRAATYAAPPLLRQLAVNVSAARHREQRTVTGTDLVDQLYTWLKLPGQRLVLPGAAGQLLDADLEIEGEQWSPVADFAFGSSRDTVYLLDRTAGALVFGDGLTARIPVTAPEDVSVAYSVGGGRVGNGGITGNWLPVDEFEGSLGGVNLVQAADGADPETVAQARERAAGALGEVTRAVTAEDHVTLATTTPGVAVGRAYASVGEHPGFPCVRVPGATTVHIVPSVPPGTVAAPRPDPGMICEVADRLGDARLITSEVFVRAPAYREVRLRVDLSGTPADRARVSTVVGAALRAYLDPLTGGDDGTGWPFGGALRPSALLRTAQGALGDLADVTGVAIALDGAAPAEACTDTPLRTGELPAVVEIRTRVVPQTEPGEGLS